AAIARQAAYDRSIGESAWRDFWAFIGRILNDVANFFRGSAAGRHVTIVVVTLIVIAVVVHFVLAAVAAKNAGPAAAAMPSHERAADAWHEAERLAALGQFTDAAHALFAALLTVFARRGEVRLHASKTAGDYARELARRGSPARGAFQQFRRRYDAVIFGSGTCDAGEYAALLRDATPMLSRGRAP
ncbi:MAG TPA: DUF4129 domain-containing protein, partial [Gemmatimonadaceae bacterium]|nr:DUF4129 domain-containing protein [Gemmatimonadaceae bacterium]